MPYGTYTRNETANAVFFQLRSKDKDKQNINPYFEISKMDNTATPPAIKLTDETATNIEGQLVRVKVEDRLFQGDVVGKKAKIYLKDEGRDELYVLTMSFRMDSYGLFNSLANLETFDNVRISVYRTKRDYVAFYVTQNGVRVDWKYKLEELPEPPSVDFKGKKMRDYSVVDEFFANEFAQLNSRITGVPVAGEVPPPF